MDNPTTTVETDSQTATVGPWRRISRTTEYDNPWIKIYHDQVKTPAHTDGIYGVVHFKNKAIGIVAVDDERHIWLVGQTRYPLNRYSWEIPEGGCPLDEDPLTAAQRELREETGLTAKHWSSILNMHLSNSVTDEEAIVYLATGLQQGQPELEDTEDISVLRVSMDGALDMIRRGDITDAISVAAILAVNSEDRLR